MFDIKSANGAIFPDINCNMELKKFENSPTEAGVADTHGLGFTGGDAGVVGNEAGLEFP